jgi:hypothetical protein
MTSDILAKVGVEGSNPFARSRIGKKIIDMGTATRAASANICLQTFAKVGVEGLDPFVRSRYAKDKTRLRGAFLRCALRFALMSTRCPPCEERSVLLAGKVELFAW